MKKKSSRKKSKQTKNKNKFDSPQVKRDLIVWLIYFLYEITTKDLGISKC